MKKSPPAASPDVVKHLAQEAIALNSAFGDPTKI